MQYAERECEGEGSFFGEPSCDPEALKVRVLISCGARHLRLVQAIHWISDRSAAQCMHEREEMISRCCSIALHNSSVGGILHRLEFANDKMRATGVCSDWFSDADEQVR